VNKIKIFQPPWLELTIMLGVAVLSYIGLSIISFLSQPPAPGEMSNGTITLWLLAFFLLSFAIAVISVIAGIGGGVIFTPIMMAFTPVDSVVIRATGLIVAMFSGLIAAGIFMKKGIGNLKMCITLTVSQGMGALIGAQTAIVAASAFGDTGEGILRIILGFLLLAISVYFMVGGKKLEWPDIQNVDAFTKWMKLEHTYYEESDDKVVSYKVRRLFPGLLFLLGIGFLGGFFGMGAGWAITPVQNLVLGVPLKSAMANSVIIIGMVDCVAVWPYMLAGGIIPLFVLPWLSAQLIGGYLGALVLVKVKVAVVRLILIGIMVFTSFSLVTDGLTKLNVIPKLPGLISLSVFLVIMAFDAVFIFKLLKKELGGNKHGKKAA
jgi:uncharacterized membrane protein YfcA